MGPSGDEHGPETLIGVGASAGGVEALTALVRALPGNLPAAVFVVLHVAPAGTSALAEILDRSGPLPAAPGHDGERVQAGRIYVAPPDCHLLVQDNTVRLSHGPRENGHRPALDPTLRSLARSGRRIAGVILSGTRDDGTAGLASIKAARGLALVQAPEEAAYDGMIRSALAHVDVDAVLPVADIGEHLVRFSSTGKAMNADANAHPSDAGSTQSTRYTCPDCGGHLHREQHGEVVAYVCEIGHRYSPASLDGEQAVVVETALWTATRLLGDRSALLNEMHERALARGQERTATSFRAQADEALRAQATIRELIESGRLPTAGGEGGEA